MNKCRVCGKKIWNPHDLICDNNVCFLEWERRKKEKYEKLKIFHDVLVDNKKVCKIFSLEPTRPWTASCVDNLHFNMEKGWSAEKTSAETKRSVDEIKFMQKVIKRVGYKNLKRVLVKIERAGKKESIENELEWLREIGVLFFFSYQTRNNKAIIKDAISK